MKKADNIFKINDKYDLEITINKEKEVLINKDCLLIDDYINALKERMKDKQEGFWDNYKIINLDFYYDKKTWQKGIIINDKYLGKKIKIELPRDIIINIESYVLSQRKIINNYRA